MIVMVLERFQDRIARHIVRVMARRGAGREWDWVSV